MTILIKWSIAAIPAAIIIAIICGVVMALLGGLFMGFLEMVGVPAPDVPTPSP